MDHFCPSYFALLGPRDLAELTETAISHDHLVFLKVLRERGVRYLLAGSTALTLHGIGAKTCDFKLLIDPERENLKNFLKTLGSSDILSSFETPVITPPGDEGELFSILVNLEGEQKVHLTETKKTSLPFDEAFERRATVQAENVILEVAAMKDLLQKI